VSGWHIPATHDPSNAAAPLASNLKTVRPAGGFIDALINRRLSRTAPFQVPADAEENGKNPSTTVPTERKENPDTQKAPPYRPGRTSGSKLPVATHTHTHRHTHTHGKSAGRFCLAVETILQGNETPNLNVTFDHFGIVEESDGALALVIHVALAGELEHFSDCWTAGVDDKAPRRQHKQLV
jgi:hypothetical protein